MQLVWAAGGGDLDPDTFARPDSWAAALLSAGGGLQDGCAMDQVFHQLNREFRLPAQHPALAERTAAAPALGQPAPGYGENGQPVQQRGTLQPALAAQINRQFAVQRFRL